MGLNIKSLVSFPHNSLHSKAGRSLSVRGVYDRHSLEKLRRLTEATEDCDDEWRRITHVADPSDEGYTAEGQRGWARITPRKRKSERRWRRQREVSRSMSWRRRLRTQTSAATLSLGPSTSEWPGSIIPIYTRFGLTYLLKWSLNICGGVYT